MNSNSSNPNSIDVQIEFSDLMDCNSVTQSMNFTLASSGKGSTPTVNSGSVQCQTMSNGSVTPSLVLGATVSAWYWKGTIDNVADGILTITTNNPQNQNGVGTGVSHLLTVRFLAPVLTNHYARFIRQSTTFSFGRARQITSWSSRIPTTTSALTQSGDNLVFNHKAPGAEMLRNSLDFRKNWPSWRAWEDNTTIPLSAFKNKEYFWKGNHVLMNCELTLLSGYRVYSNRVHRFQIGQLLRVLPPPLCMPTMGTACWNIYHVIRSLPNNYIHGLCALSLP